MTYEEQEKAMIAAGLTAMALLGTAGLVAVVWVLVHNLGWLPVVAILTVLAVVCRKVYQTIIRMDY